MNQLIDCKKFPNSFGCATNKDAGFFSKVMDTSCSLASKACWWGILPKKYCKIINGICQNHQQDEELEDDTIAKKEAEAKNIS